MRIRRSTGSVNMTDVAHRAGVSQSTVSRVLSRHPAISDSTRELVQNALRELGYKSESEKTGTGGSQKKVVLDLVMCPLPEQTEPFALDYFSMILQGARDGAAGTGCRIQTISLPADAEEITDDFSGDGVILLGYPAEGLRRNLKKAGIPYIVVSGDVYARRDEDLVSPDNFECGVEGGKYLISRGYRRIGFILSRHNLNRYAGFEYALRMEGLEVRRSDLRLVRNTDISSFIEIIHHWIREKDLPEAIVVGFNDSANAIETILKLNEIRVPEDVLLMSFEHNPARANRPCLCSKPHEMGHIAVARLMEKIQKTDSPVCWSIIPMTLEGLTDM
ncbi:MAG: LacI family DNA-binding transcriptional regulator [Victivallales bacterium]